VLLVFTACVAGLVLWIGNVTHITRDPLFRGKAESQWIKNLKYNDSDQVKEWQGYGEEGIQVLIRGLEMANPPGERAYRKFNRRLPAFLRRWLPAPKPDATRSTRMCLVSLLWSLSNDAKPATEVMVWSVRYDEDDGVRQSAIGRAG